MALISSYSTLFLYDLPFFIQFPGLILATATELHQGASAAAANRERDHVSRRQWGGRPRGHQRGLAFRHLAQVAGRQSLPLREGHQAAAYNSLYVDFFFFCSGSQVWHLTAAELEQGAISTLLLCDGKLWVAVKELIGCFDPAKCVARFSVYQRESG